jgi:hypothetical protein
VRRGRLLALRAAAADEGDVIRVDAQNGDLVFERAEELRAVR